MSKIKKSWSKLKYEFSHEGIIKYASTLQGCMSTHIFLFYVLNSIMRDLRTIRYYNPRKKFLGHLGRNYLCLAIYPLILNTVRQACHYSRWLNSE